MPNASPHPVGDGQSPLPLAQRSAQGAQVAGMHGTGCVDSHELLRGQKTVEISHNGSTYRLQATRLGKLILTK